MKKLDFAAIALSLIVVAFLSLRVYAAPLPQERSVLIQSPAGKWIFPLSTDSVFSDAGPAGTCVISIRSGTVRVLSSDCPRMVCIQTGAVSRPGAWIACLPHQVFIRVTGGQAEPDREDAVAF